MMIAPPSLSALAAEGRRNLLFLAAIQAIAAQALAKPETRRIGHLLAAAIAKRIAPDGH